MKRLEAQEKERRETEAAEAARNQEAAAAAAAAAVEEGGEGAGTEEASEVRDTLSINKMDCYSALKHNGLGLLNLFYFSNDHAMHK